MEEMGASEFTYWMAFYQLEERDTKKAIEEAEQKAKR